MELAIQKVGGGTPTGLANVLKLGSGGYQKVYRWQQGAKLPYAETMKILDKLGWLNMDGVAEAVQDPASPADPLAEIATTVSKMARGQAAILDQLGVPRSVLEPPTEEAEPPQVRPKGKRG